MPCQYHQLGLAFHFFFMVLLENPFPIYLLHHQHYIRDCCWACKCCLNIHVTHAFNDFTGTIVEVRGCRGVHEVGRARSHVSETSILAVCVIQKQLRQLRFRLDSRGLKVGTESGGKRPCRELLPSRHLPSCLLRSQGRGGLLDFSLSVPRVLCFASASLLL